MGILYQGCLTVDANIIFGFAVFLIISCLFFSQIFGYIVKIAFEHRDFLHQTVDRSIPTEDFIFQGKDIFNKLSSLFLVAFP